MDDKFDDLKFDFENTSPILCIFCEKEFDIEEDVEYILNHLLISHKFVINSYDEIADFPQYLRYWQKLKNLSLEEYCDIYVSNLKETDKDTDNVYVLSNNLQEDSTLRSVLGDKKLKYVVENKARELNDTSFSRQCFYCSEKISGGVVRSFDHLSAVHGFTFGNPHNIVFGAKFLDCVERHLKSLRCINCEKTFKNHVVLREHMRKKQHRSIHPKNKFYDKFFLVNYLKPGTPWEQVKEELKWDDAHHDFCEETEDAVNDDAWTDWKDEDSDHTVQCLFCPFSNTKAQTTLDHMNQSHNFHFENLTSHLSYYGKVKVVNFIRSRMKNRKCPNCDIEIDSDHVFTSHINSCTVDLSVGSYIESSSFLIPVIKNDGLLMFLEDGDVEDDSCSTSSSFNEEIVFPEDPLCLTSILRDKKLRDELSSDTSKFKK